MSFRGGDQNAVELIRSLSERVTQLERQTGARRQNTMHLNDWVIEAEADTRVKMTNLKTKAETYIGDQPIPFFSGMAWSYAGTVANDATVNAPKMYFPIDIKLNYVTVSLQTPSLSTIEVVTHVRDAAKVQYDLPFGEVFVSYALDIDVPAGMSLYPQLLAEPTGTGTDLSVVYWYSGVYHGVLPNGST